LPQRNEKIFHEEERKEEEMDLFLRDRVAVITGGASGIGEKTAEFFIREQARVLIADVRAERIEKTVSSCGPSAGKRRGSSATCGTKRAPSNGGAGGRVLRDRRFSGEQRGRRRAMNPLETAGREEWQPILDVNLTGTINCCQAVIPALKAKKGGRIVNLASEAGVSGEKGLEVYAASKGGVIALTKSLAKDLGWYGITVNAVAPAFVHSPMTAFLNPELEKKC